MQPNPGSWYPSHANPGEKSLGLKLKASSNAKQCASVPSMVDGALLGRRERSRVPAPDGADEQGGEGMAEGKC